jgi:hypothetical protein
MYLFALPRQIQNQAVSAADLSSGFGTGAVVDHGPGILDPLPDLIPAHPLSIQLPGPVGIQTHSGLLRIHLGLYLTVTAIFLHMI